jgi:hypothetical protein
MVNGLRFTMNRRCAPSPVFTMEEEPERPAEDEKQGMDFCK